MKEERDFDKVEDGEDDVTPPAKPVSGSSKVIEVDPSLLMADEETDKEREKTGVEVKEEEEMQVDAR